MSPPKSALHEILEKFAADAENVFAEAHARIHAEARGEARTELAAQLNQAVGKEVMQ